MIAGCRENLRDAILRIYSEAHKIDKRRAHEEDEISQAHSLPGDPDRARHGPPACAAGRREPRPLDLLHTLHHLWPGVRPDHDRQRRLLSPRAPGHGPGGASGKSFSILSVLYRRKPRASLFRNAAGPSSEQVWTQTRRAPIAQARSTAAVSRAPPIPRPRKP